MQFLDKFVPKRLQEIYSLKRDDISEVAGIPVLDSTICDEEESSFCCCCRWSCRNKGGREQEKLKFSKSCRKCQVLRVRKFFLTWKKSSSWKSSDRTHLLISPLLRMLCGMQVKLLHFGQNKYLISSHGSTHSHSYPTVRIIFEELRFSDASTP